MSTDEEIREICSRLVEANDSDFEQVVEELKSALRSRFERLSNLAVATILKMPGSRKPKEGKEQTPDRERPKYGT